MDEETEDDESTESPIPATTSSSPSPVHDHERDPFSTSVVEHLSPCYQVGPSPTGGVGLFATRPIPRGTVIFSEPPLFTQPLPPYRTNSTILNALAQRTREEQCAFFALSNAYKTPLPGHPVLLGRDHWAAVAQQAAGDAGARGYLRTHDVALVECGDLATGHDVDAR